MANLESALRRILGWEGGYVNDKDDSGGPTMRGVTIATYKNYCKLVGKPEPTINDLKNISYEEIYDIAYKLYWSKIKGDFINNQSIADLCFDCVWGSGTGYIKVIQKVLGVTADGIFGPNTLNAINNYIPQEELFNKLWNRRKKYFEGCSGAWKYLRGWLRRLNSFTFVEEPINIEEREEKEEESESVQQNILEYKTIDSNEDIYDSIQSTEVLEDKTIDSNEDIDKFLQPSSTTKDTFLKKLESLIVDFIKRILKIN